jgi:CO/xanthine dehydrogenase FAD-binding subunit
MGSVGPTVLRARDAEAWAEAELRWDEPWRTPVTAVAEFGRLASAAALPIDDHRSTAAYRRHGIGVLAARGLSRALARLDGRP